MAQLLNLISGADVLLTRQQAAAYLNLSPQTLANWKRTRGSELPFIKVGQRTRYRKSDLDAFIRLHTPLGRAPMAPGFDVETSLSDSIVTAHIVQRIQTILKDVARGIESAECSVPSSGNLSSR